MTVHVLLRLHYTWNHGECIDTGMFCNAASSLCRSYAVPTCAKTNGVAPNTGATNCACGDGTDCASGLYCLAASSQCSTDGTDFVGFSPTVKMSGRCDDDAANGWGWIEDLATCEKAVAALGSSHTNVAILAGSYEKYPPGCFSLGMHTYLTTKILPFIHAHVHKYTNTKIPEYQKHLNTEHAQTH